MISAERKDRHERLISHYGGSKQSEYAKLVKGGYYLPPQNCAAVTRDYLLGIKQNRILSAKEYDIQQYPTSSLCRYTIYCVLKEIAIQKRFDVGFPITALPSKKWMLTVAYFHNPEHSVFIKQSSIVRASAAFNNRSSYKRTLKHALKFVMSVQDAKKHYKPLIIKEFRDCIKTRIENIQAAIPGCVISNNEII